ncbi:riboflavin synthase [Chloroflexota bacterium]
MFNGIIEEVGKINSVQPRRLVISADRILSGLELGGSVSVNGVCLTVINFSTNSFSADIMLETLKRTNLGLLRAGDEVNLERPMTLGGWLGGHFVQGHVDNTGRITSIVRNGDELLINVAASPDVMRYIVEKSFISIDGISLTVVDLNHGSFRISIVDYTRHHTTLSKRRVGDLVNLEVDIIAKYVERVSHPYQTGITTELLGEYGFLAG